METFFPYINFIARTSNIVRSMKYKDWVTNFEEDFDNVVFEKFIKTEIYSTVCDTNKIDFDVTNDLKNSVFTKISGSAILYSSNESLFFLLMALGEDHTLGSTAIRFLKSAPELFVHKGGSKFMTKLHKIFLSFEEDEFNEYYLIVTTHDELINHDQLFNHSRRMIKGY